MVHEIGNQESYKWLNIQSPKIFPTLPIIYARNRWKKNTNVNNCVNSYFLLSSNALCYRSLQLHNKIGCFVNDTKSNHSNCPFWLFKLLGEQLDTLSFLCDDQRHVQLNDSTGWSQQTQIKPNTVFFPKNSNCLFTHWDHVTLTLYAILFSPEKIWR